LDSLTRKTTQRVEAMDGRAKLSFANNQIGLPPIAQQNLKKTKCCKLVYRDRSAALGRATQIGTK
tara:strand:- start:888 stop:1082 length:195 start_codon:yes stop_codon:yes gene_type:complete